MLDLLFGRSGSKRAFLDSGLGNGGWGSGPMWRIGRMRTQAGPVVDEDLALTYAAVWCATRLISETLAGLPKQIMLRDGENRKVEPGFYLYEQLRYQPNPAMGGMTFREGRTMHQVNWGNGFAEIEFNGYPRGNDRRQVVSQWPVHPSRVRPVRPSDNEPDYDYWVRNNDGTSVLLKADELLHVPGTLSEDGIWGKGVIQHARESVGFGIGTERHGATFFGSGAQPKGVLTAPGMKDPEIRRNFREEWKQVHGSPDSGEIAILPETAKFTPISMTNEDNQFLETRKQNDLVIAQWYRVPPHMIMSMESATFSNIEAQGTEFLIYTLMPWVRRWEDEENRKLLTLEERRAGYFIEYNLAGLLRGDRASRFASYVQAIQNGIMTINECRRLENLNGIGPAGDQNFVQLNMTTVQRMLEAPSAQAATSKSMAVGNVRCISSKAAKRIARQAVSSMRKELCIGGIFAATQVLRDALLRMFNKEANAAKKVVRNPKVDFDEWLAEFHVKHKPTVATAVAPACGSLSAAGRVVASEHVAAECIAASKRELTQAFNRDNTNEMAARLEAWPKTMSDQLINKLLGSAINADCQ